MKQVLYLEENIFGLSLRLKYLRSSLSFPLDESLYAEFLLRDIYFMKETAGTLADVLLEKTALINHEKISFQLLRFFNDFLLFLKELEEAPEGLKKKMAGSLPSSFRERVKKQKKQFEDGLEQEDSSEDVSVPMKEFRYLLGTPGITEDSS